LPLPVAIWIRARGQFSANDFSSRLIALLCAGQKFASSSAGISRNFPRTVCRAIAGP
jgi:hypothetical protein